MLRSLAVAAAALGLAAVGGDWAALVPGLLAAALLGTARIPRWGPWAQGGAWAAGIATVALVGLPVLDPLPVLAVAALAVLLLVGLHGLDAGVPLRWRAATAAWAAVAALVLALVAWQASSWGAPVAGLDPLTAPGLAWSALLALLVLALAAVAWMVFRSRPAASPPPEEL